MPATTYPLGEGGTRWRRFALPFIPGVLVIGVMFFMLATGALAVSFSISGIPFILNATQLSGTGFTQYGIPSHVSNGAAAAGLIPAPTQGASPVATKPDGSGGAWAADTVTVLGVADISALNQTVCMPLPGPFAGLGRMQVTTRATTAHATGMLVDAPQLSATSAVFNNMAIGNDAGPALGSAALNGQFSQTADNVTLNGLHQVALGTTAGSFTLNGLQLEAAFVSSCP